MKKILYHILTITIIAIAFSACVKDEEFDTSENAKLEFSTDTVLFDTVFTSIGSATQIFKIYNPSKNRIKISSIRIASGQQSAYRFNVDGQSDLELKDIEVNGKDSAFVFVKVTIDPTLENAPLVNKDSLVFITNNNTQDVKLIAWGQDAYFYNKAIITSNHIFKADKPHVIYNYLIVDSLRTLEIEAGARVHMHPGAFLLVYHSASLKVKGTAENPVIIEGDRLEDYYKTLPGQWGRIWLYAGSVNNEIDHAIIRNGEVGIQVDTVGNSTASTLRLTNSRIQNMTNVGLLAQGSRVEVSNCVISNCGSFTVALSLGGSYDFRHTTIGDYWENFQKNSGLLLNNYYVDVTGKQQARPLEKAYFGNCIIYGENNEVLNFDKSPSATAFNYFFDHCLIRTPQGLNDNEHFRNSIKNQDPYFKDPLKFEYQLDSTLSAAINKGTLEILNASPVDITRDITGTSRITDAPDLGAYEFVPKAK